MRLIGQFPNEKKAYAFYAFLREGGIASSLEPSSKEEGPAMVWVIDEDDFEKARDRLEKFNALSAEEQEKLTEKKEIPPTTPQELFSQDLPSKDRNQRLLSLQSTRYTLTYLLIALCALLFFWNLPQENELVRTEGRVALQIDLTPLQRALVFDFPSCLDTTQALLRIHPLQSLQEIEGLPQNLQQQFTIAQSCPYWRGAYDIFVDRMHGKAISYAAAPLFEKIRQGEIWRLFTPVLLHASFLHILFNMLWLMVLGKQIEERIGKWRMIVLILIIGIVSNVAQYLFSGPYFMGFSGIVCGMAGFIWMRQKICPWEGYPLNRSTILFLAIFVLAMLGLEVISLGLELFGVQGVVAHIANTAHVVGGITGLLLARIPIFSRMLT